MDVSFHEEVATTSDGNSTDVSTIWSVDTEARSTSFASVASFDIAALNIALAVLASFCALDVTLFFIRLWFSLWRQERRRRTVERERRSLLRTDDEDDEDEDFDDASSKYQRSIAALLAITSAIEFFIISPYVLAFVLHKNLSPEFCEYFVAFPIAVVYRANLIPSILLSFFIARVNDRNPLGIGQPQWFRAMENFIAFKLNPVLLSLVWFLICACGVAYMFLTGQTVVLEGDNEEETAFFCPVFGFSEFWFGILSYGSVLVSIPLCVFYYIRAWGGRSETFAYTWFCLIQVIGFGGPSIIFMIDQISIMGGVTGDDDFYGLLVRGINVAAPILNYTARSYLFKTPITEYESHIRAQQHIPPGAANADLSDQHLISASSHVSSEERYSRPLSVNTSVLAGGRRNKYDGGIN